MRINLNNNQNEQISIELYNQFQTCLNSPEFSGEEYCDVGYEYHVFSRHDKNTYNVIQDHLSHSYIFLHWNSYLFYSDEDYHYEVISIFSISKKEIDNAIDFCNNLHKSNCQSTLLLVNESEIDSIIEMSKKSNYKNGPTIIWDSELLGGHDRFTKRSQLSVDNLSFNNIKMIDFFDAINFDNKGCWIVQYADGNAESMFRSFDMYWFYPQIIDYIDHKKYVINYSTDYEKLLDEEDFKNALFQISREVQKIRERFDNLKLELLQQIGRAHV